VLVVWGKKIVRKALGIVADFCPICRCAQAFRMSRVSLADHLYFVAVGEGQVADFVIECTTCGVPQSTNPAKYVTALPPEAATMDVWALAAQTFPRFREVHGARLDLEARIAAGETLPPAVRKQLLLEPFAILETLVQERARDSTRFDTVSGSGCITTVLLPALVGVASCGRGAAADLAGPAALVIFVAGTVFTLVQIALGPRRHTRGVVVPVLAGALRALRPSDNELEACLMTCRARNWRIGRALSSDAIAAPLRVTGGAG